MDVARDKISADSNASLLSAISAGDKNSEHAIITKYYKSLFFIIRKQTQDVGLAEDICQDTFLKVLEKARAGDIKKPESLSGFIRHTGVNILIEFRRKQSRRKTDLSDNVELLQVFETASYRHPLESKELFTIVEQLMDELPTIRDRDILRSFFVQGKDKLTICNNLDINAEHFDRVLYRARQRLKQTLAIKLNIEADKCNLFTLLNVVVMHLFAGLLLYSFGHASERLF